MNINAVYGPDEKSHDKKRARKPRLLVLSEDGTIKFAIYKPQNLWQFHKLISDRTDLTQTLPIDRKLLKAGYELYGDEEGDGIANWVALPLYTLESLQCFGCPRGNLVLLRPEGKDIKDLVTRFAEYDLSTGPLEELKQAIKEYDAIDRVPENGVKLT